MATRLSDTPEDTGRSSDMPARGVRRSRWSTFADPSIVPRLGAFAALMILITWTMADADLWGHVRFGRDIVHEGALPRTDPYSFTSDEAWVNHEWAAEVIMYGAYRAAGPLGLILLKVALVLAVVALLSRSIQRHHPSPVVYYGLLGVAVWGTIVRTMTVRPQLFSLLLFAALLVVLVEVDRGRRRLLVAVPALFALWANLHGGWIVGLLALAVWSAAELLASSAGLRRKIPVAIAAMASLLATGVNPYGIQLLHFVRSTVGFNRADIAEWQPAYAAPAVLADWVAMAGITVAAVVLARGGHRRWRYLLLTGCLAVASFRVARLDAFFAISLVLASAPVFAAVPRLRGGTTPLRPSSRRQAVLGAAVTAAAMAGILFVAGPVVRTNLGCITMQAASLPEPEAGTFVVENGLAGRMLTWFDYGEYAIWYFSPRLKISMDGRRETVYSDDVREKHWRFYLDGRDSGYARAINADYVWLPRQLPAVPRLREEGWREIFRGSRSVILSRGDLASFVSPGSVAGPRCFPGP